MAFANPKLLKVNAVLMAYVENVLLAFPGPPDVITKGISNICIHHVIFMNNTV